MSFWPDPRWRFYGVQNKCGLVVGTRVIVLLLHRLAVLDDLVLSGRAGPEGVDVSRRSWDVARWAFLEDCRRRKLIVFAGVGGRGVRSIFLLS